MKKTILLICFLVISISGFGQLSMELEKMLNHRIISNRTLWRVNTFMEVYSDSTNPNSFLEKDYQRLFFKNYESEKISIHLIDSMEFNEFLIFDFTFYWRCSCKTDEEFLEK